MNAMREKTVLVTGATSGIGERTALELARKGARLLLHGRTPERVGAARDRILAEVPDADVVPVVADLWEQRAVRDMAERIRSSESSLNVVVHSAGVFMTHRELTPDGRETTLAVNHLAPFLLTVSLLPLLEHSAPARVVTVSSVAHFRGRIDFTDLDSAADYDGYQAYANTKLMNVLFSRELAVRTAGSGVTSNSLHPGVIDTKLLHRGFPGQHGADVGVGAATPVYLASSPEVDDVTGRYFVNQHQALPSPAVEDAALRHRLWQASEALTALRG